MGLGADRFRGYDDPDGVQEMRVVTVAGDQISQIYSAHRIASRGLGSPIGPAALITIAVTALGTSYFGWRIAREIRNKTEIEARTRIREAKTAEEIERIRAEVERARMDERRAARELFRQMKEAGVSEEELALAVAAATGDDPSEVLRELREAKKEIEGEEMPPWAWALIGVMGFMVLRGFRR